MRNGYAAGREHIREMNEDRRRWEFLRSLVVAGNEDRRIGAALESQAQRRTFEPVRFDLETRRWIDELRKQNE